MYEFFYWIRAFFANGGIEEIDATRDLDEAMRKYQEAIDGQYADYGSVYVDRYINVTDDCQYVECIIWRPDPNEA